MAEQTNVSKNLAVKPRVLGLSDLRDEIDRLWETVMSAPRRPFQLFARQQLVPAMDVFEKEGQLHIRAEIPGMSREDVEITATGDIVTITGEKKEEREVKEENYYSAERSYGKFSRQIALPVGADVERAAAGSRTCPGNQHPTEGSGSEEADCDQAQWLVAPRERTGRAPRVQVWREGLNYD